MVSRCEFFVSSSGIFSGLRAKGRINSSFPNENRSRYKRFWICVFVFPCSSSRYRIYKGPGRWCLKCQVKVLRKDAVQKGSAWFPGVSFSFPLPEFLVG